MLNKKKKNLSQTDETSNKTPLEDERLHSHEELYEPHEAISIEKAF